MTTVLNKASKNIYDLINFNRQLFLHEALNAKNLDWCFKAHKGI